MSSLTLFDGSISDGATALTLTVRRDLDNSELPVAVIIDGDTLALMLDQAAKLARAGERIERALFKSTQAPKETSTAFAYKIGFGDGTVGAFELGIVADPLGVALTWNTKRLALGLGAITDLLFALAQVDRAVDAVRGLSQPPSDDTRGAARPFQPSSSPAPGTRWQTWTPRTWSDPSIGGPGW